MYKRYDIVFVDFGINKGSVQCGIRPAIIVSNDFGNKCSTILTVVPTTSKDKPLIPTHFLIHLGIPTTILCEQIVTISKKQVLYPVNEHSLTSIEKQVLDMKLLVALGLKAT